MWITFSIPHVCWVALSWVYVQNLQWVEYLWTDDYCGEARVRLGQAGSEEIWGSLGSHNQAEFSASLPNLPFVRTKWYFCILVISVQPHEKIQGWDILLRPVSCLGKQLSSLGRCCSIFGRISEPGGKAQACGNTECKYLSNSRMLCEPSPGISVVLPFREGLLLTRWNEGLKNPILFLFLSWKSGLSFLQYLNKCVPAEDLQ